MLKSAMPSRKGRSKLDLVKMILEKLESCEGEQIPISTFQELGLDTKRTKEYIELINWILENGKKIEITKVSKFTFIKLENGK